MRGKSMFRFRDPLGSENIFDVRSLQSSTPSNTQVSSYVTASPGSDTWLWVADFVIRDGDIHIMGQTTDVGVIHPAMVKWLALVTMSAFVLASVKQSLAKEAGDAINKAGTVPSNVISFEAARDAKRKRNRR